MNIKTVLIISPTLLSDKNTKQIDELKSISREYINCVFLDYSQDQNYNFKQNLFSDMFHLNKTGAEIFSKQLCSYLNSSKYFN